MNIKHCNWYGFDHEQVKKRFGVAEYLGDLPLTDGPTLAMYRSDNPNRELGHKDLVFLTSEFISGKNMNEIEPKDYILNAISCIKCENCIYSPNRHGMIYCECQTTAIDGGADYIRIVADVGTYLPCTINLLTQEVEFYK